MDVVVKGRNVEVGPYRDYVVDKLQKAARLDPKILEIAVELIHEPNPRQQDNSQRVEITCVSRGPVVRAESTARDFHAALDDAVDKLVRRLRRAVGRRRELRRRPAPTPAAVAPAVPEEPPVGEPEPEQPWRIRRTKEHPGEPITVDEALFRMELVGHDFYLFMDKESGRPSVVYRRKGYDYGVISLAEPTAG